MQLTVEMTRNITVADELMRRLRATLGDAMVVELVTVIASYNMVSRVLVALAVGPEDVPAN